jgi:hypothetical protein
VTLTFRKRPGGRLELATNHQGPPRSTITASGTRPQVGDADTTCCSAAALTPLTRRGMGVVRGLAAGSATAPFARAEPEPRLVTAVRYRLRLAVAAAARQAGQRWGRLRPLGLDAPATPLGRRPGREGAPAVIGLVAARRQRRRRARIPPNSNTRTTTMISTHNHVDMAASLVGAGAGQADTTAAHSGKQLPRVQAMSRAGIDGRATRELAGPLHPATCPPIWAGRAGARPTASLSSHRCALISARTRVRRLA